MKNITNKQSVTLYTVPECPLCANVRRWLEQNGVAYSEHDVANDFGALRAMYRLTRQGLVPVIVRNGRAIVRPTYQQLESLMLD